MNILTYEQNTYKNHYKDEFVTGFSHGLLTKGAINIEQSKKALEQLNNNIKEDASCVCFKAEHIKPELEGGACSAVSLRVAKEALGILPKCHNFNALVEKVTKIVADLNTLSIKKNTKCSEERQKIRSLQMAFNTITVTAKPESKDVSREKIEAITSYFDLKISECSQDINVHPTEACSEEFTQTLAKFTPGVYLCRSMTPPTSERAKEKQEEANRKQELHGHSTVYIKDSEGHDLYFDVNSGLFDLSKNPDSRQLVFQMHCGAQARFGLDSCRFYKLENNNKAQA